MPVILTCTDGSRSTSGVCHSAAWAAQRLQLPVQLLHVIDHHREHTAKIDFTGAIGMDATAELTEELAKLEQTQGRVARLQGKAIIEEAARKLAAAGITNVTTTQRHGEFLATLEELEPLAELVVVGKHGTEQVAAASPLGHHLEGLVRMSVRPVLVAAQTFKPVQRFLVAFDNSPSARKAVAYVAASPLLRGLDCYLLMVGRADASHETALQEAREQLVQAGHSVTAELKPGNPAAVIAAEMVTRKIDLLVMGAYGHSQIREFIVGSTTTKLVRSCPGPVLMFR